VIYQRRKNFLVVLISRELPGRINLTQLSKVNFVKNFKSSVMSLLPSTHIYLYKIFAFNVGHGLLATNLYYHLVSFQYDFNAAQLNWIKVVFSSSKSENLQS